MKRIYPLIALFSLLSTNSEVSAAGGWRFLAIPQGAREISLGETGVSRPGEGAAVWWSPATVTDKSGQAWFQSYRWLADTRGSFGGASLNARFGAISAWYFNQAVSGLELRDRPGPALGEFDVHQAAIGLAAGWRISREFTLGATWKGAIESIYGDRAQNWTIVDLGALYRLENWSAGGAVRNIGSADGDSEGQTLVQAGVTAKLPYGGTASLLSIEGLLEADGGAYLHSGLEVGLFQRMYVRGGFMVGHDTRTYSAGLGLVLRRYSADFSYSPFSRGFGGTWRMGLGIAFGQGEG